MSIKHGFQAAFGATCPSLQAQFTPLHWELAISWGPWSLAVAIGPFAIRADLSGWDPEVRWGMFDNGVPPWRDNEVWHRNRHITPTKGRRSWTATK